MLWPERERSQVGVPSVACEERMCDAHPGARSRVQHTRAAREEGVVRSPCALCFSLCVCDHPRGFRRENAQDAAAWKLTAWARKLIEAAHNGTDKRGIRRHKAARKIGVSTLCCV